MTMKEKTKIIHNYKKIKLKFVTEKSKIIYVKKKIKLKFISIRKNKNNL